MTQNQRKNPDKIERLLKKVISNRRKYTESIKGEKVFVQPSIPKGGVVGFRILGRRPASADAAPQRNYEKLVREINDA